jgi:hypothetical protein
MNGFEEFSLPEGQQRVINGVIFPLCVRPVKASAPSLCSLSATLISSLPSTSASTLASTLILDAAAETSAATSIRNAALSAVAEQRPRIDELLREHKCILFRGCCLRTPQDFHDFIMATGLEGMDYVGGAAVRTQLTERVFTANESPSSERIPFHHEMA